MQLKIIVAALFVSMLFTENTFAKWEEIGKTPSSTLYVDPLTISRSGNLANILYLENFDSLEKISGVNVNAIVTLYQFNCDNNEYRTLGFYFYSNPMGSGYELFKSEKKGSWKNAAGALAFSQKIACGLLVKK